MEFLMIAGLFGVGLIIGRTHFPAAGHTDQENANERERLKRPSSMNYLDLHDLGKLFHKDRIVISYSRPTQEARMLHATYNPEFTLDDTEYDVLLSCGKNILVHLNAPPKTGLDLAESA